MKLLLSALLLFTTFFSFGQWTGPDAASKIYYTKGFVGIGDIPQYRFHLKGSDEKPLLFVESPESTFAFSRHFLDLRAKSTFGRTPYIAWYTPAGLRQAYMGWENYVFNLTLENGFNYSINGGNVGIGTTDTKGYLLAVAGKAVAEEIVVKLKGNWPDYVFEPGYQLRPLRDVSVFIKKNNRLPEMPSADTVRVQGINLNEMTSLLLKKVEELTLYVIQEKDQSDALLKRVETLESLLLQSTGKN